MAIAFDAGNTGLISGASSLTISLTVGSGSDRALVVSASCLNSTNFLASATVTWDGTSMGSPVVTPAAGAGNNYVYTWVLANPASGTHNVVITPSGSAYVKAAVSSWTGVDQTTPVSASAKSVSSYGASPFTLSIAASSGVAVDFLCDRAASKSIAPGAGQTQIGSNIAGTLSTSGASYKAGATSVQWTHPDSGTANLGYAVIALAAASAGDTTAPTLTSPTGTSTGSTTATVGATTDEGNGTLYAVVTTSATAPTKAQVKAGQNAAGTAANWSGSVAVSSTGAKTLSATGLTASTTYYAHLMHEDAATNQANVVTSASFTTSAGSSGSKGRFYYQFGSPQC